LRNKKWVEIRGARYPSCFDLRHAKIGGAADGEIGMRSLAVKFVECYKNEPG